MYHSGTALLNSRHILEKAHVHPGMHIADIGCGSTGHIVFPALKHLDQTGAVYAVDIQPTVLERIYSRARFHGVEHMVYPVWSNIERHRSTRIPEASLDVAFIAHVLHQLQNFDAGLSEVKRLLKSKSRLVIVEWLPRGMGIYGRSGTYIPQAVVTNWGLHNGFVVQEAFNPNPYAYGVVLYRHA